MNKDKNEFFIHLLFALVFIALSLLLYYTITTFGLGKGDERIKVGFILDGDREDNGWNQVNADGIYEARDNLDFDLMLADNINGSELNLYKAVKEMQDEGCHVVVLSSSNFESLMEKYSGEFSDITFFCNAPTKGVLNFVNYSSRLYQVRYLSGVIAGMMTKTNNIGYVASIQNADTNTGINAFALGAEKVNANVHVHVMFIGSYSDREKEMEYADRMIKEMDCDIITDHTNTNNALETAFANNAYYIGCHKSSGSPRELISVDTDWGKVYTELIKEYMRGNVVTNSGYWYGIEDDYVKLGFCSYLVPSYVLDKMESEKRLIVSGRDVFTNMIRDNKGNVICRSGEVIPDDILNSDMDWYVRGVNIIDEQDQ
ncbi:MAG: BMP family ABC transporter substrate-binding protein [Lachnospiraceae bacterium]|nr:BMP family ABC transporter substrate-binding protein [Lachnospiraceae bacterium]